MVSLSSQINLRWAGIEGESVVDGPGLRAVVFFQGCPHHCLGCHNPDTWDPNGGRVDTVETIWQQISGHPLLRGVTLSGGEPFLQPEAAQVLARMAKARGWDVMVYTGYTWEELMANGQEDQWRLLEVTDILVDGRYLQKEKDPRLVFRGSRNQRIIDVPRSLVSKTIELWEEKT